MLQGNRRTRPRGYIAAYRPYQKTLALLDHVDEILAEYDEQLPLTVRQILYRLKAELAEEES